MGGVTGRLHRARPIDRPLRRRVVRACPLAVNPSGCSRTRLVRRRLSELEAPPVRLVVVGARLRCHGRSVGCWRRGSPVAGCLRATAFRDGGACTTVTEGGSRRPADSGASGLRTGPPRSNAAAAASIGVRVGSPGRWVAGPRELLDDDPPAAPRRKAWLRPCVRQGSVPPYRCRCAQRSGRGRARTTASAVASDATAAGRREAPYSRSNGRPRGPWLRRRVRPRGEPLRGTRPLRRGRAGGVCCSEEPGSPRRVVLGGVRCPGGLDRLRPVVA